jgi:hypothetical protein
VLRRALLAVALTAAALLAIGDHDVHAGRCTPLKEGKCRACSSCNYCGHCAKGGGRCSVCK